MKEKTITKVDYQLYYDIVTVELLKGAIENNEFPGFREDYHLLHCLIRKYQPRTFMEIGTNCGTGTNIICNAGKNWLMQVYSLDLPTEECHKSLQHPVSEGKGDKVGSNCSFHYKQLRGDSMTFDFGAMPCEGYFCDGEHDYEHVCHETTQMLNQNPKIVIYHDADLKEVRDTIVAAVMERADWDYDLFFIKGTRIAYAVKVDQ